MTPVASSVPERYPRGSKRGGGCCGRVLSGCCLGWSVGFSGFPLRHTRGNPGDQFLSIEISLDHMRTGDRKIEALLIDLRISV